MKKKSHMPAESSRHRAKRRGVERGAAMVEAIVIMTTMLVFLGMNMWAYAAYGGKIDQANSTRRDALYYASHQCEVCTPGEPALERASYTQPQLAGTNCGGNSGGALSIARGIFENARDGNLNLNSFFGTSRSTKSAQVFGTAVVNTTPTTGIQMSRVPLVANVGTASLAGCNEKPYSGRWSGIFSFGLDFFKSLVR